MILYVVFVVILKTGGDVPHFGVYLLLGIVLWNYFLEVTTGSVGAIVGKGDIMRKVNFPRYVIVLAGSIAALINLIFNLLVVSLFLYIGKAEPNHAALLFPLLVLELFVLSLSISFFLSAAYVRLRDLNYIWEVLVQAGFYATPILYAFSYVSDKSVVVSKAMMLNPLAQIIQDARYGLVTDKTATISSVFQNRLVYLVPLGVVALVAVIATRYFRKHAPYFAEEV
jgi:ABC-2 type transport system permease protein